MIPGDILSISDPMARRYQIAQWYRQQQDLSGADMPRDVPGEQHGTAGSINIFSQFMDGPEVSGVTAPQVGVGSVQATGGGTPVMLPNQASPALPPGHGLAPPQQGLLRHLLGGRQRGWFGNTSVTSPRLGGVAGPTLQGGSKSVTMGGAAGATPRMW